jgi:hypothetical protein
MPVCVWIGIGTNDSVPIVPGVDFGIVVGSTVRLIFQIDLKLAAKNEASRVVAGIWFIVGIPIGAERYAAAGDIT